MSLDKIIWYVNGVEMPTPSGVKYDFEDLDNQSYRSVIDGSLIRDKIASEFIKIQLSYKYLTPSMAKRIRDAIKINEKYTVKFKSPILNDDGDFVTFVAYTSKMSFEMLEMQVGYSASFSIIQVRK